MGKKAKCRHSLRAESLDEADEQARLGQTSVLLSGIIRQAVFQFEQQVQCGPRGQVIRVKRP